MARRHASYSPCCSGLERREKKLPKHSATGSVADPSSLEERIELTRKLPANILHLPSTYSLLKDTRARTSVGFSLVEVHPLALTDLLKEVV